MRIAIREQLGLLVLFCCLVCVAVISVAVWITNTNFVTSISSSSLSLAATLYAQQLATNLLLVESTAEHLASRISVQFALGRYNQDSNNTAENWARAISDLQVGLGTGGSGQYLVQCQVYGPDTSGPAGAHSVMNVTSNFTVPIELPQTHPNGSVVLLGDQGDGGYPAPLYPHLNLTSQSVNSTLNLTTGTLFDTAVNDSAPLVVGPWQINSTFSLLSITVPILNNSALVQVVGWLTVVFTSDPIYSIQNSSLGLGNTGVNLIVGPDSPINRLPQGVAFDDPNREGSDLLGRQKVHFITPPTVNDSRSTRHASAQYPKTDYTFTFSQYSAVQSVFSNNQHDQGNAGSNLDTYNEEGDHVSVGYALVDTAMADWAVIVEQAFDEVYEPIINLRNVLLACIFGTVGVIVVFIFPLAHYSVRPIRDLRAATLKTVDPYSFSERDETSERNSIGSFASGPVNTVDEENQTEVAKKEGFITRNKRMTLKKARGKLKALTPSPPVERKFRIPGKVKDRKHVVTDELTDLSRTFNDMAEELMMQYGRLEERVKERTVELELSKKAAEAANESKTLFIANISHELKTPLNGIMGMCAVSMSEDDPQRIKRSLGIIYKSGDLLLNLLTDLLTFSKNQIGQHLTLDEKEFRLADISSQVLSIFDKQAEEGSISLDVVFEGPNYSLETASGTPAQPGYGPFGTGRVRDMWLWGDQHRILQVVINLVSNSLKFTPPGGSVTVRIKCLGEAEPEPIMAARKDSTNSKKSKETSKTKGSRDSSRLSSRFRRRGSSSALSSDSSIGATSHKANDEKKNIHTALEINSREPKSLQSPMASRERSSSPVPINARILIFDFDIEDTGPGIPPAQQQKIFEPFVQGDLGLSKKYGGTGLGLSICAQLAGLMKGKMSLHSVEGEGSVFSMQIPLRFVKERAESARSSSYQGSLRGSIYGGRDDAIKSPHERLSDSELSAPSVQPSSPPARAVLDSPVAAKPRLVGLSQPFFATSPPLGTEKGQLEAIERVKAQAASSDAKVRVLVAEDNKVNQEVVLRMLKLEDIYDVTVAKDGQEAYDMVKESMETKKLFSLIFMDVQMPNLDGLQSTRLIRGMGFSAPIVALTAFAEESNVQECMDSGMDFFLPKPIRRPALKQVLKRYCTTIPESEEPESPPLVQKSSLLDGATTMDGAVNGSERTPSGSSEVTRESKFAGTTAQTTPLDDLRKDDVSPLSQ